MDTGYHQRIRETYNEWKTGDIDKGIVQFYKMYCEKHDYTSTHNLGVLILYENDFVPGCPSPMDLGTERLLAIDLLNAAEKLNPGREKNALALSLCYHFYKDYANSLSVLSLVKPEQLKNDFLWMAAANHMVLSGYDQAQALLKEIIDSDPDTVHLFWALYAMIYCRHINKENTDEIMPDFRKCVTRIESERETADPWYAADIENMLISAIPFLLLFGESEDYRWLTEKQEALMTDVEKEFLNKSSWQNRKEVDKEISEPWASAKEIIFDLFEFG